jgi:hypothetical protein
VPVPAPEQEVVLPQAITDVTVVLAKKIMQAAKKNARGEIKRRRQAEADDGENVAALKKKLKTAMDEKKAAKASHGKDTAGVKLASASIEDSLAKPPKHKLTRLDRWQLGNKAARERQSEYVNAATCTTLKQVRLRLKTYKCLTKLTRYIPSQLTCYRCSLSLNYSTVRGTLAGRSLSDCTYILRAVIM